ncbi:MAG: TolC family protein [Chlamydiota bacterium]
MVRSFLSIIFFLAIFLTQGCDVRGANDPFSYTPRKSDSLWQPPAKAEKGLPARENLKKDREDDPLLSNNTPISFAEIIDISLSRNPDTKRSWATARVSAAEYGQSLRNRFILADIDSNYSRSRFAEFTGLNRTVIYETHYSGELDFSYTILDFGQTRMSSEAARQSLYNADWSHNSQIQLTIRAVMTDYYDYLYQKKLLLCREQDVINATVSLDATEEKFRQGLADVSDIVQAKTSYLSQKLAVVKQKQTLHTAYTALVAGMGLPSDQTFHFQDYPGEIVLFKPETVDQLIAKAHNIRPDLLAAEAAVRSTKAGLTAAKLQKFPTITGELELGKKYFRTGVNDHYDFTAQINLTFPLLQGFFIDNSIRKARATLERAEASLDRVKLDITQQVSNYRSAITHATESIEYATAYLESAEEDFKVNLKKYRVGTGTIVDLINAQTAVADARAQLAQAQNNWYTSIADLAFATGILFPPKEEKKAPYIQLIEQRDGEDEKSRL